MTDVNASGWDAPAAIVFTNTDTTTLRDMDLFPAAHTPAALSREADLPYRRRIRFARTGDYCITVTPGRPVKGIEAVGINIVKSE